MNGAQYVLCMFLQDIFLSYICLFLLLLPTVKRQNAVREIVCFFKKIFLLFLLLSWCMYTETVILWLKMWL